MGKIIEGVWDCPHCKTKGIRGSVYQCPICGEQRGQGVKFYIGEFNKNLPNSYTPSKESIPEGPDWLCPQCHKYNPDSSSTCLNCGTVRSYGDLNYLDINSDEKNNVPDNFDTSSVEEEIPKEEAKIVSSENFDNGYSDIDHEFNRRQFPIERVLKFAGIGLVISLVITLVLFLFWPKTSVVTVDNLSWKYNISVEEYRTFYESGWILPAGARIRYSNYELYGYEDVFDHYETVTETVPYEVLDGYDTVVTGTRDMGNGYFEEITSQVPRYRTEYRTEYRQEPVYRSEPIYKMKYYYDIDRWTFSRNITTSGNDKSPYFGDVVLAKNEREGSRIRNFSVTVSFKKDKINTYNISEEYWRMLEVGNKLRVKTNLAGSFEILKVLS